MLALVIALEKRGALRPPFFPGENTEFRLGLSLRGSNRFRFNCVIIADIFRGFSI